MAHADPRSASKRLRRHSDSSTCHTAPAREALTQRRRDRRPRTDADSRRVLAAMTTAPGSAKACSGREVRRLANDGLFLRRAFADQIADDHQPVAIPTRAWSLADPI